MTLPSVGSLSPPSAADTAPAAMTGARRGPTFPNVPVGMALAAPIPAPAGGDTCTRKPTHGHLKGYTADGCRCDDCRAAYSGYKKAGRRSGAAWVERDRARHAERLRERRAAGEDV